MNAAVAIEHEKLTSRGGLTGQASELVAEDQFYNQVIRAFGQPKPDPKIEFESG